MEKIKLLLYCTKGKPLLYKGITAYTRSVEYVLDKEQYLFGKIETLNGKIVAECDYEVEKIRADWGSNHIGNIEIDDRYDYYVNSLKDEYELCKKSCLTMEELDNYLQGKNGYAIHIKNLNIFDKPRELSDFYRFDGFYNDINNWKYIDKAPQNMMYAYELISELGWSGTCNRHFEKKIIISIRPEYLVKILNKEKTIEVRKKVLKEMVK